MAKFAHIKIYFKSFKNLFRSTLIFFIGYHGWQKGTRQVRFEEFDLIWSDWHFEPPMLELRGGCTLHHHLLPHLHLRGLPAQWRYTCSQATDMCE